MTDSDLAAARADLSGRNLLRAAINTSNPVLVNPRAQGEEPTGVSIDLARELGRRLDLPVELVVYDAAGRTFEGGPNDEWDVAFLAIEPARAEKVTFTAPYVEIEGTYLVQGASALRSAQELDQPGRRIGVVGRAAYDLYLTRTIKHAELVRAPDFDASFAAFQDDGLDALAGIRQPLDALAARFPDLRVLPDRFMAIRQAMVITRRNPALADYAARFVDEAKASGFVRAALDRHGHADVRVPD